MRKSLAITIAALLCCTILFGQKEKHKTSFGFKAGGNLSTFRQVVSYKSFDAKLKLGMVLGAFVDIPVKSSRFSFQPEFLYSQMGAKAFDAFYYTDIRLRYNYFSVPVLIKYRAAKGLNVFVGPEADFLIRAKVNEYRGPDMIFTNIIKDFDFAFTVGIEAPISRHFTFNARYIHGSQDVSTRPSETTFFNQGIQATFGYKLLKNKKAKTKKAKK